jgi:FkbM family methyltransferase
VFIHSFEDIPINSKICIYGKGSRSLDLAGFINMFRSDIKIVYNFDSSTLDDFLKSHPAYDFIIIASIKWQEIKDNLAKYNIDNYKILSDSFSGIIQDYLSYQIDNDKCSSKLPAIRTIFKFEPHKKLYELLYNCRTDKKYWNEPIQKKIEFCIEKPINPENHYLEFLIKDKINTFIDAGVYDGISTKTIIKELTNIKNVYGFEPLKNNFDYSQLIDLSKLDNFKIYTEGLWHKSEILNFSICEAGSAVTENKSSEFQIKTICIDEFAERNNIPKVDFIKMDIENAELNALKGGIKTILKDRPQLAISIYHSLEQFIEIPLFLKQNLHNYSYYLGHYSYSRHETVLYAIPKELER